MPIIHKSTFLKHSSAASIGTHLCILKYTNDNNIMEEQYFWACVSYIYHIIILYKPFFFKFSFTFRSQFFHMLCRAIQVHFCVGALGNKKIKVVISACVYTWVGL